MPGTVERTNRFVWPALEGETNPDLKRSFVWEAETLRRAVLDAVWRIAMNGVTRECLADGSIPLSKLDGELQAIVGIEAGAVTLRKLAALAFAASVAGRLKMADGFATGAKFAERTITSDRLAPAVGAYTIPAGTMVWFGAETPPYGWFECNGQEKKIADYPALAAACGTRWGMASGGPFYFKLPDFRGSFERGWAHGTTNDPDKASRVGGDHVGSSQGDAVKPHSHTFPATSMRVSPMAGTRFVACTVATPLVTLGQSVGSETVSKNICMMKIIKW